MNLANALWIAALFVAGCGNAVSPMADSAVDARDDSESGDRYCAFEPCASNEVCKRNESARCAALPAGCTPTPTPRCTVGVDCPADSPCEPCVAEVLRCPAGQHCVRDWTRSRFVDAVCAYDRDP